MANHDNGDNQSTEQEDKSSDLLLFDIDSEQYYIDDSEQNYIEGEQSYIESEESSSSSPRFLITAIVFVAILTIVYVTYKKQRMVSVTSKK